MSTPTTTAITDLDYSLESDLPVIPALANIDHIRVIDKLGASYRATPEQMREMVGIDYSILTEQIVPGEFFVGKDGARKQVYSRLFKGTLPAPNINATTTLVFLRYVDTMLWCHAFYINKEHSDQLQINFYVNGDNQLTSYISFVTESSATNNTGQPYYAYCKYTIL